MKIDIWSDVVCPFCYIGKRQLQAALSRFEHRDKVEITLHAYELDANAEKNSGKALADVLAAKFGTSKERVAELNKGLEEQAAQIGLTFDLERAVPTNSHDAHRLIRLAGETGMQYVAEEELFAAYFTHGKDISDHATLTELGIRIGLDAAKIAALLQGDQYTTEVRDDERQADELGVTGVPFFMIEGKYGIPGALPAETFMKALEQVWEEMSVSK